MRRGDALDRQVAHRVHGVEAVVVLLVSSIAKHVVRSVLVRNRLHDVNREHHARERDVPGELVRQKHNLLLSRQNSQTDRSFPPLQNEGKSVHPVHPSTEERTKVLREVKREGRSRVALVVDV